ncbi:hypothetical protein TNCV_4233991 [Trichonephila clavipes]|nr:hypothetical protein TNCV_4233991 [Trichonephila clavipes]
MLDVQVRCVSKVNLFDSITLEAGKDTTSRGLLVWVTTVFVNLYYGKIAIIVSMQITHADPDISSLPCINFLSCKQAHFLTSSYMMVAEGVQFMHEIQYDTPEPIDSIFARLSLDFDQCEY